MPIPASALNVDYCLLLLIIALPSDFLNKSAPYIFRISLVYFWYILGIFLVCFWDIVEKPSHLGLFSIPRNSFCQRFLINWLTQAESLRPIAEIANI